MPPKEAKDNGMADGGGPDLTGKILFDPSVAVQFKPVEKKQVVKIIVTNTSTHNVGFKWKTTAPGNFKIRPPFCHVASNKTQEFRCFFRGLKPEQCQPGGHLTVVYIATSPNTVLQMVFKKGSTNTKKKKLPIKFTGMASPADPKLDETQQPTNNDEAEDKDRQGTMRSRKVKDETKKAMVMFVVRKEGDSFSDDDDEESTNQPGVGDDMQTTRPAGNFTGQVQSADQQEGGPKSEFKTTRPAGNFTGQVQSADQQQQGPKSEFKTTRPAGNFTGQVQSADQQQQGAKSEFKTTRPAGNFTGQVQSAEAANPPDGGPNFKTTRGAGEFKNQVTENKK